MNLLYSDSFLHKSTLLFSKQDGRYKLIYLVFISPMKQKRLEIKTVVYTSRHFDISSLFLCRPLLHLTLTDKSQTLVVDPSLLIEWCVNYAAIPCGRESGNSICKSI